MTKLPVAKTRCKMAQLTAEIRRADGTVEHVTLGYWHRNPLKRFWFNTKTLFGRLRNWLHSS